MNIIKPVKSIISISAVCAAIAFSSMSGAYAAGNDFGFDGQKHHQSGKHMMKRMTKVLSLSEAQQIQIKALKTQAKEQHELQRESMKKFKDEEKLLLRAESFDEQAYIALHVSYQDMFTQVALTRAKTKHAIFNVLTTEQQEKWLAKMDKRKKNSKKGKRD
ncbi:Spy/CpxP family protein refolding chaperone [Colwellia sp. E150_009]|jgi:protein CpxP